MSALLDEPLFEVPEEMWVRRRCAVCGCALSVLHAYTYFVQRQGWVKIGATNMVRRRVNELRRPAWVKHILAPEGMDWTEPLTTLLVLEGDIEHQMHQRFREHHVIGEWFSLNETTRAWIEEVTP